jgi:hypothetical protein
MLREFFIQRGLVRRLNNVKITSMARRAVRHSPPASGQPIQNCITGNVTWESNVESTAKTFLNTKDIKAHKGNSKAI